MIIPFAVVLVVVFAGFLGAPEGEVEGTPDEAVALEEDEAGQESEADEEAVEEDEADQESEADEEAIDGPVTVDATLLDWDEVLADNFTPEQSTTAVFIGSGDDIIDLEEPLEYGIVSAHHRGERNFQVRASYTDGDGRGLVNEIGGYSGTTFADRGKLEGLDVTADGEWAFVIEDATGGLELRELARAYEGNGDSVVLFPEPTGEFSRATFTHDGESNFQVREFLGRGLVNEIGAYEGTVRFRGDEVAGFVVQADGRWAAALDTDLAETVAPEPTEEPTQVPAEAAAEVEDTPTEEPTSEETDDNGEPEGTEAPTSYYGIRVELGSDEHRLDVSDYIVESFDVLVEVTDTTTAQIQRTIEDPTEVDEASEMVFMAAVSGLLHVNDLTVPDGMEKAHQAAREVLIEARDNTLEGDVLGRLDDHSQEINKAIDLYTQEYEWDMLHIN